MKKETQENNEFDITDEDLQAIGDKQENLRLDNAEDQALKLREEKVDFAGSDLDIPGREVQNKTASAGIADEENQLYSQGSSENEHLEQQAKDINL